MAPLKESGMGMHSHCWVRESIGYRVGIKMPARNEHTAGTVPMPCLSPHSHPALQAISRQVLEIRRISGWSGRVNVSRMLNPAPPLVILWMLVSQSTVSPPCRLWVSSHPHLLPAELLAVQVFSCLHYK
jgi:hypothetical protein